MAENTDGKRKRTRERGGKREMRTDGDAPLPIDAASPFAALGGEFRDRVAQRQGEASMQQQQAETPPDEPHVPDGTDTNPQERAADATEDAGFDQNEADDLRNTPSLETDTGLVFWQAADGAAYVDTGASKLSRVVHGGVHRYKNVLTGKFEYAKWDTTENGWIAVDKPVAPIADEREAMLTQPVAEQAPTGPDTYPAGGLEHAQENLRKRMSKLSLDDESRTRLSAKIASASAPNEVMTLSSEVKQIELAARRAARAERKAAKDSVDVGASGSGEAAPAEATPSEPVPQEANVPVAAASPEAALSSALNVAEQVLAESPVPPKVTKSPRDLLFERTRQARAERRARIEAAASEAITEPAPQDPVSSEAEPTAQRITDEELPARPVAPQGAAVETEPARGDYIIDHSKYEKYPPMSLTDILHDETHQQYFGELLHKIDPNAGEAQMRFAKGTATREDMALMTYATYEYRKWNSQWQQLSQILNEDDVMRFQRSVASLDNIAATIGRGRGLEKLKNVLRHAAMTDQSTFLNIGHAIYDSHDRHGSKEATRAEQTVDTLAARLGMPRAELEKKLDMSTRGKEAETMAELTRRYQERAGGGRKMMDWLTNKTGMTFGGSSAAAAEQAIKEGIYAVGQYRGAGVQGMERLLDTDSVREEVNLELRDQVPYVNGIESGPKSFAAMQTETKKIKQEDMKTVIQEFIAKDPAKWAAGGPSYQDAALSEMKQKVTTSLKAGNGFWAWLLKTMCGDTFDKAAHEVTGRRPAHVH